MNVLTNSLSFLQLKNIAGGSGWIIWIWLLTLPMLYQCYQYCKSAEDASILLIKYFIIKRFMVQIHWEQMNTVCRRIFFLIPPSFDSWNWLTGLSGSSGFRCMCVYIYICNTVSLLAAHFTIYGTLMANNEIKNIINTTLPHNMSHDASTCTLA